MAKLLGPDGNPISSADLNREIAMPTDIGVRSVHREGVASGLTPDGLAAILRDAANGYARRYLTLAEEMEERYLHYASVLQTRRLAIEAIEPTVEAGNEVPSKITDFANELVAAPRFREMVGELTDGIAKGYSVCEIIWDYTDGKLRPVSYIWRDQRFFQFDRTSLKELRLATDGNFDGLPLSPGKYIRHMPRSKMGIPLRRGVARAAAWAFMLQSFSLKDWAAFSEVYGMPIRIGKYGPEASKDDIRTLLQAVRMIASDAAAVVPKSMEMLFEKVDGQHGTAVFGGMIGYVDKNISKAVVGQTMTSDEGGSLAQARVHNEVRQDILRADGRQLSNTVGSDLVEWAVAFNFGPQSSYPHVGFPVADPEDIVALASALADLVPLGLRADQGEVLGKLGLSEPKKDAVVLEQRAPAAPALPEPISVPALPKPARLGALAGHVAGCRCGGCLAQLSADLADQVDDGLGLTDTLLATAAGDFTEITDPLLGPLALAASKATTLDEALAMIRRRGPDGVALLEQLAIATATARGIGDTLD